VRGTAGFGKECCGVLPPSSDEHLSSKASIWEDAILHRLVTSNVHAAGLPEIILFSIFGTVAATIKSDAGRAPGYMGMSWAGWECCIECRIGVAVRDHFQLFVFRRLLRLPFNALGR
jgi:hypothetical protein